MPIYDKPVWQLMRQLVEDIDLKKGEVLRRDKVLSWFTENYPKIKRSTISAHLLRMSVNAPSRVYYHGKPSDDDLFYQIDSSRFRLYEPDTDPPPIYKTTVETPEKDKPDEFDGSAVEFAYEADLRNFLAKNLQIIEPGLSLYKEEGIKGIEFPVGGRFIDILALNKHDEFVVIELKVSRGYDRVIGQLLRYLGWVKENMSEENQLVRGVIVARSISEDLLLACRDLPRIKLFEYELSVALTEVQK